MRVDRGRRQDVLNDPLIPQFIIHGSIDMLRSILEMRGVPFDSERFTQISRETARELREMAMRAGISSDIFDMATQLVESAFTHQERAQAADSLLEDLSGMNIAQMNVANVLRLLLQLADAESGLGLGADGRGQSRRERGDSTEEEMDSDRVRELRREARRRLEELVQASDSDMTDYEVTSLADQIEEGMHNGSFYLMDHPNSVPEEQRTSQHALVPGMVPRRIEAEIDGLNFHTGDPELSQRLTDLFGQRRADRRGPRVTGDQE
jgi:hypothetical protein